jgi:predicted unusual protein kinase regulating ubiquinone biosynthesis (AarF/ABC1/UbiB family)
MENIQDFKDLKPPKEFFGQSRTTGNSFEGSAEVSRAKSTAAQAEPKQLRKRARKALWFGFQMIAGFIWWEMIVAKIVGRERVDAGRMPRFIQLARRFRALALDLGGVWIKLGQFLSSRVDIIPPEVIVELQGLQDAVPPEPPEVIKPIVEQNLGKPINDIFDEFDPQPIAAASFGQAHLATLKEEVGNGAWGIGTNSLPPTPYPLSPRRVIVKVQRPNLEAIVSTDIASLKTIIKWMQYYKPIRRRANLKSLANEFADVIYEELDYEQEARNADQLARNFAKDPTVRVPKSYLASKRVLVLENVEEIKITDFEGLESAGISRAQVANKLFETYLQQIFVDGFFHADPHPGNLFVQPLDSQQARKLGINNTNAAPAQKAPPLISLAPNSPLPQINIPILSNFFNTFTNNSPNAQSPIPTPQSPPQGKPFRLIYIDFGMMGRVTPASMRELKEFIIATSLKDARRLTAAAQRMGFFTPEADTARIEQAIGGLFDRVWGMNMNDLTNVEFDQMYSFAVQFKDLISSLPFQIPQNVLYLGRATNILSGMCTALDAKFNPWLAMQPFGQDMAGAQTTTQTAQDIFAELLKIGRLGLQLPGQTDTFMSRALNGQLEMRAQLSPASTNELRRIETSVSRLTWALVLIALAICGTLLLINSFTVIGVLALLMALAALLKLITL